MPITPESRLARGSAALAVALALTALLAACEPKKDRPAQQAAAKVNQGEVTVQELDFVLQQQKGLKPEQMQAASKQVLERLIDQELAVQKAVQLKLDAEPKVQQQIDAARREIIARAYADKAGEAAAKPTADEVAQYFDAHPALFKERRIYSLQEIAIEARPEQLDALRAQLQASKSVADFVEHLKAGDFRFSGNQAVRAAEQLPLASLGALAAMKDGQAVLSPTATGALVVVLAGSRMQPVTLEQATPAIEQFLLNERRRELVAKDLKGLRDAAKIEYLGAFAGAAAAPASAAASGSK